MKKNLAKVIMMGLLCASVLPSVGEAGYSSKSIYNITGDTQLTYNYGTNMVASNNAGINIGQDGNYVINQPNLISSFYLQDSSAIGIFANFRGTATFTGNDLSFQNGLAIDNGGSEETNLVFNNRIQIHSNGDTAISNEGKITFNGALTLFGDMNNSEAFITNMLGATLNINNDVLYNNGSKGDVFITNRGTVNIDACLQIHGVYIHNAPSFNSVEPDDAGAITNINLKQSGNLVPYIQGDFYNTDDNFKLTLNEGSYWFPQALHEVSDVVPNIADVGTAHNVTGVCLNGGTISFAQEITNNGLNRYKNWNDTYYEFALNNFTVGSNVAKGGIELFTDLANDKGDRIDFTGTTPADYDVPVIIFNKDDNNGVPITESDGHKVTIVTAPSGSDMKISADRMYCSSDYTKVYEPIIKKENTDENTLWNFVGWGKSTASESGAGVIPQHIIDPVLPQVDTENTFKRINELRRDIRTDPSEVGVWMRGETGETKIGTYGYDYNLMSGGYDWHKENDARILFTGVGFSYATNDCDDAVVGDTKSYGVNLYGSWYGKAKNEYVDLVLRYGQLDKEYAGLDRNGVFVSGEYDKDMFSIAAKYGRRIFKDDWYWEPSVGFTWGRVGSADFIDNLGTNIHADSTNSLITSLGMQVGKNIKGIEYYGKAEVMHDFDGKIHVSAPGIVAEDDMGGTWVKCAIGASRKIDENNSFYLEVERDFGNKVEKPYGFSAGYRFTW